MTRIFELINADTTDWPESASEIYNQFRYHDPFWDFVTFVTRLHVHVASCHSPLLSLTIMDSDDEFGEIEMPFK